MKRLVLIAMVVLLSSPIAIAQDFCEGDFDYDGDLDGTDASLFKSDFGRSLFFEPCPSDGPAPVKKTGWTSCFDLDGNPRDCEGTGEDGEYQKGAQIPNPRFTDNGDGTVSDNLTGLIWLKLANCFGPRSWNNALSDSSGLENGECGLMDGSSAGDWRLPNRFELESLVDLVNGSPPLPSGHPFTNVQTDCYWSSTDDSYFHLPWCMNMVTGHVTAATCGNLCYDWPVRGGQ